MKKLLAILILGLSASGFAMADGGYFSDHQGDFSNVPVDGNTYSDTILADSGWGWRMIIVPTTMIDESTLGYFDNGGGDFSNVKAVKGHAPSGVELANR